MTRYPFYLSMLFLSFLGANPAWTLADAAPESARSNRGSSVVQGRPPPAAVTRSAPVIRIDPARALGAQTATVAIVEFADYQCPYCRTFHIGTFPRLQKEFVDTGKVRYFHKDFPLPNHPHAFSASIAAHCAGAQGRYWQMQDLLYTEQARLGAELYIELAEELKLDRRSFQTCSAGAASRRAVNRDVAEGDRLGVRGTPTFAIGRMVGNTVVVERMATGVPAYEVFATELEALLR